MLSQHPPELIAIASKRPDWTRFQLSARLTAHMRWLGLRAAAAGKPNFLNLSCWPAARCCREVEKFVWGGGGHTNNSALNAAKREPGSREHQLRPARAWEDEGNGRRPCRGVCRRRPRLTRTRRVCKSPETRRGCGIAGSGATGGGYGRYSRFVEMQRLGGWNCCEGC